MDVLSTVKTILAKRVDISKLKEDDPLTSIGIDSLDLVEVMLEIETNLKVEFTSDELSELVTLKDVITLINSKIK